MPSTRRLAHSLAAGLALAAALIGVGRPASGDSVILNNGIVYRGTVDRDKPLMWVYDGLKRVVLRDSKVKRMESDASYRNLEVFKIEQPLVVHGGSMPKEVLSIQAKPWNDRGRRAFAYEGSKVGKFYRMEQAINEMGPHLVKIRGVDGYWQGMLATNQVPRDVVLGILAKVERKDKNERIRVARFLIQAEWYAEARAELERILKDFPDDSELRERVAGARASVLQLEAVQTRTAIDRCRAAQQPHAAAALLKSFASKDVAAELYVQVQELRRAEEAQEAADKTLADDLQALSDALPPKKTDAAWSETKLAALKLLKKQSKLEVLKALKEAPDAVRDRLVAWQKAKLEGTKSEEAQFALAMSGFVLGSDAAVEDLETASTLWSMRNLVRDYLASTDDAARSDLHAKLEAVGLPGDETNPATVRKLDTVTRLAQRMAPFKQDDEVYKGPKIHRVLDDDSEKPTEYTVTLPPEYHPLRSYPAVVALHDGGGMAQAVAWWSEEAAKRGYIVVAPEDRLSGQETEYQFSASEHAAVELALRDARKRYAIDSDRIFLGGQLVGGNMAWDFGLAHPDLFAGVAVVSGLPFKYVFRYQSHVDRLPLYVALGDLAPAANEVVFGQFLKPLILKAYDVTYSEYIRRGLEDLPEEVTPVFDWMDRRRRDPYPKEFSAVTARPSDNRFYGVVIREHQPGRTTAPEAVDPDGKNLNPATLKMKTSNLSNLLNLQITGIKSLDVWVTPKVIDFKRKMEVRINNRAWFKGLAKPDLEPLLEDLRIRGDRQQVYWMKVSAG